MHSRTIFKKTRDTSLALFTVFLLLSGCHKPAPEASKSWVLITPEDTREAIIHKATRVIPTQRQIEWQRREFIGFVHFNLFTFATDPVEAGPDLFNPAAFDANQWVQVCKDTGMKMVILTAKHHRGFCLWPSEHTDYSVAASPWRNGEGDVVGEVAAACRGAGLELGVYLSPWDMHEPSYGTPAYDEFFMDQLSELLTNYGPVAEVWFDGHYGGPEGGKHDYNWHEYYRLIRELQPGAVIAISGPDVRWVGNEKGYARTEEWSVVPVLPPNGVETPANGAFSSDHLFPPNGLAERADDIGGRSMLFDAVPPYYLVWYPAETDVSIRPSWVYKPDEQPRSLDELLDIYYHSVGRNSVLLLNFAPDRRGLIPDADVKRAEELRAVLDATFDENLALDAEVMSSDARTGHEASAAVDENPDTYWTTPDGIHEATLELNLGSVRTFNRVVLQEYIRVGQRYEAFVLEAWDGTEWAEFGRGTTIGYKRILRTNDISTDRIRLVINGARASPTLCRTELYYQPPLEGILGK